MGKDLKGLVKENKSLKDIIDTMNRYYNLDQPLGIMSKSIVINSLEKVIKICNLKER